jgi:thiol-disulfide isomerase/thioredoxin
MNRYFVIIVLILLVYSCKNHETKFQEKQVSIQGKILSEKVQEIKFYSIIENPLVFRATEYLAKKDSISNFSIKIPIERLAAGLITAGEIKHEICFLPGDIYNIEIGLDSILYKGKGAEKNNFLYATEKIGISDSKFKMISRNRKISPSEFLSAAKEFKNTRLSFLESYPNKKELEPEFLNYYKFQTQIIFENQIQNYYYKHKAQIDSLDIKAEYLRLNQLSNIIDDERIISGYYIPYLDRFLTKKRKEIMMNDTNLKYKDVIQALLLDSLHGKTQEYVLASKICSKLSFNTYDSLLINELMKIERDHLTSQTVEKALDKYNQKQSLIGQPLHPEFAETKLADTSNSSLTFEEMMNRYKGNIVFLDIWALNCGPCRMAMPHSKKIKERLSDLPIEFVYITEDSFSENLWTEIFNVSLTNENHYRMINGRGSSRMCKFMDIYYVPSYMIFDKEGKLIDFTAERPFISKNGESELEKTLRKLVE